MAELPYMPVHVADAIADAEGLTNEELGALTRIRWALWRAGGLLAETRISRYARSGKRWGSVSPAVLERLQFAGGKASCPLVTALLVLTRERRAKRVKAGRASAAARVSEGAQNASSEGILNGRKPLNFHETNVDVLGPVFEHKANNHNQNREIPDASALEAEGTAIVKRCLDVPAPTARRHIAQWCAALNDDAKLLALLRSVEGRGLKGPTFLRVATEAVNRETTARIKGGVQRDLPLRPVAVAPRKQGAGR